MPVDWYNGGMEHTTLHLLYSRFWAKFLYDIDILQIPEPYRKRTSHGMILGEDNQKMSKSRGNVVNPDDIVNEYGADTLRLYEMFIGDFEKAAPWSGNSIKGCKRFLERFAGLYDIASGNGITPELDTAFHKTIKKVTGDIEEMKFNTAIAAMMSLTNEIYEHGSLTKDELKTFASLLCPFAPHICEEIWHNLGETGLCSHAAYPTYDEAKTVDNIIEIVVQFSGKIRGKIQTAPDSSQEQVINQVKSDAQFAPYLEGKQIIKEIYVKNKLVNIVVK